MTEREGRVRVNLPGFVQAAEKLHREGRPTEAERLVRDGLDTQPDCADAVLLLARLLLERDRGDEALQAIESYAGVTRTDRDRADSDSAAFGTEVSDRELDDAFAQAESEREQMFDADAIAQSAIRQADAVAFEFADSSFATRTVAGILERQGDAGSASAIRERVEASDSSHSAAATRRDRRAVTVAELERWLANLQGGMR